MLNFYLNSRLQPRTYISAGLIHSDTVQKPRWRAVSNYELDAWLKRAYQVYQKKKTSKEIFTKDADEACNDG